MSRRREFIELTAESKLIKELREQNEMSLRELADEANVSVTYLHQLELGKVDPKGEAFEKVLKTLCPSENFAHDFLKGSLNPLEARDSALKIMMSLPLRILLRQLEDIKLKPKGTI